MAVATVANDIDQTIKSALNKLKTSKISELCKYLPGNTSGYMRHLTFGRLKKEHPEELEGLLQRHVLNISEPKALEPPPRAERGSRKVRRKENLSLSSSECTDLLKHLKQAGDERLIKIVRQQICSLAQIKRELIQCIRQNEPARDLFESFCKQIESQDRA